TPPHLWGGGAERAGGAGPEGRLREHPGLRPKLPYDVCGARLAQGIRASVFGTEGRGFESLSGHSFSAGTLARRRWGVRVSRVAYLESQQQVGMCRLGDR